MLSPMLIRHHAYLYTYIQAWSKTEAHHVSFVKRHLCDMLISLSTPPGSDPPTRINADFKISASDFNALGFLLAGGEGLEESSSTSKLSDLIPFWKGRSLTEPCPFPTLASWLDDVLCVNELFYPPPSDPFALPTAAMEQSHGGGGAVRNDLR